MKRAKIIPATWTVLCPHCGEAQVEMRHGSQVFEADQLFRHERICCSCAKRFLVHPPKEVTP